MVKEIKDEDILDWMNLASPLYGDRVMSILPLLLIVMSTADAASDVIALYTAGVEPTTLLAIPLLVSYPFVYLGLRIILTTVAALAFLFLWRDAPSEGYRKFVVWTVATLAGMAALVVGLDCWHWFQVL